VHELGEQGNKYRTALYKCLTAQGFPNPHIAIVFVVGTPLSEEGDPRGPEMIEKTLDAISGRVILMRLLSRVPGPHTATFWLSQLKRIRLTRFCKS